MRHIVLSEIGLLGQDVLLRSKVLCIGAGGLGSPVLTYLVASGVGFIGIVDFDVVDLSNLNRQFIYSVHDLKKNKVNVAERFLNKLNDNISIFVYDVKLNKDNFFNIMNNYDIIVDCTDSLESKFLINDFAMSINIPLIHGSVFGFSGYVSVFSRRTGCYRCLYKSFAHINCVGHGILGPVAGVVGSIQAIEVIKYLLYINEVFNFEVLISKLLVVDLKNLNFLVLNFNKFQDCISCN